MEDRNKQLESIITDLAKSLKDDSSIDETICRLCHIYEDDFRHQYSLFFPMISEIGQYGNSEKNLDYLSNNLSGIMDKVRIPSNEENKRQYRCIFKLCDHLMLEISRYSQSVVSKNKLEEASKNYDAAIEKNKNLVEQFETALEAANKRISTLQSELITTLTIFSAIVLTFAGGIQYISGALSGINAVRLYKSTFCIVLCGLVMFNTIFLLLYLVGKITKRNIYANCKTSSCKNCLDNCCGIKKIFKRLPYVFWVNAALIFYEVVDIIYLFLGNWIYGILVGF